VARDYEGRAVVSAGASGRAAGAVLTNDSMLKYEGFGYDKVMSRTLNALNYMLAGDLEGALVEVRKAEEYQRLERERRQREVQQAARIQEPGAESARLDNPAVAARYGRMLDYVKNVRNSFENAFTYYLASQLYLARGEAGLDDAMVEIRRAFELAPQAPGVRAAYLEIARRQGGPALDEARARLRVAEDAPEPGPGPSGSLVICYEAGLVPQMEEVRLSLYANDKLYNLAFPIYNDFGSPQEPLGVQTARGGLLTSRILDTRTLAVKSLQERMPGILVRGLLGAIAKGALQQEAEEKYGFFAGLASKVASLAFSSADRRSWLSLPAEVQVAQRGVDPGPSVVTLRGPGWRETVNLDISPGSHSFILVRAFPGFRRVDARTFRPEGGEAAAAAPPAAAQADLP